MTTTVAATRVSKLLRAAAARLVKAAEKLEAAAESGKGRAQAAEAARVAIDASYDTLLMTELYERAVEWKPVPAAHRATKAPAAPTLTLEGLPKSAEGVKGLSASQVREAAKLLTLPAEEGETLAAVRKKVLAKLVPPFVPAPPSESTVHRAAHLAQGLGLTTEQVLDALKKAKLIA